MVIMSQLIPKICVYQEDVWSMVAVDATEFGDGHINTYYFKRSSRSGNQEKASEWRANLSQTEVLEE